MKIHSTINIESAIGGFVIQYANATPDPMGLPLFEITSVTEVVEHETTLLTRISEIIRMHRHVNEATTQLNG